LQEIDDCHAVIGGDEDAFGHYVSVVEERSVSRPASLLSCELILLKMQILL
jgi:hypothetical protein